MKDNTTNLRIIPMKKPSQSVRSTSTTVPDLTNYTEAQLLKATADQIGEEATPEQRQLLDAITDEFKRREKLVLFPNLPRVTARKRA
ncbi:hypothetical protein J2P12_00040 [Candidatus Bathyarchaeota archaeon]|nr:hypothetical protein [Candidatus Bathyarchaeota archaeon]